MPHLGQDAGVHPVGLGEDAGGAGELARLLGIDPREGDPAGSERLDQPPVAAARDLEDDEGITVAPAISTTSWVQSN